MEEAKPKMKRRISVQSAKAKGKTLQNWTCQQISDLLGLPWGPDEYIASREGAQIGTDVRLVGPALEQFPYAVECKFQESWSIHEWIKQAKSNEKDGTRWLLIAKKSRIDPVVVMDAKYFFELLRTKREAENHVSKDKD